MILWSCRNQCAGLLIFARGNGSDPLHFGALSAQGDGHLDGFGLNPPPDVQFLSEDEALHENDLFLHNRQDSHVACGADLRCYLDNSADRHTGDVHVLVAHIRTCRFFKRVRDGSDPNMPDHHLAFGDGGDLLDQRDDLLAGSPSIAPHGFLQDRSAVVVGCRVA
jgi:hypothetical protein